MYVGNGEVGCNPRRGFIASPTLGFVLIPCY